MTKYELYCSKCGWKRVKGETQMRGTQEYYKCGICNESLNKRCNNCKRSDLKYYQKCLCKNRPTNISHSSTSNQLNRSGNPLNIQAPLVSNDLNDLISTQHSNSINEAVNECLNYIQKAVLQLHKYINYQDLEIKKLNNLISKQSDIQEISESQCSKKIKISDYSVSSYE